MRGITDDAGGRAPHAKAVLSNVAKDRAAANSGKLTAGRIACKSNG
jgi:hypothetical protein